MDKQNQIKVEKTKLDQQKLEAEMRQQMFEQEMKFEREKLAQKLKHAREATKLEREKATSAKLPKLVIAEFKGEKSDWLRFWSEFEAEVDAIVILLRLPSFPI